MGERSASFPGFVFQKSLFFCLFFVTSLLFILSWFFVLRSASRPFFTDGSFFPSHKLFALSNSGESEQPQSKSGAGASNTYSPTDGTDENPVDSSKCNANKDVLKVFMYNLPPEFHFELLNWKASSGSVWPDIQKQVPGYPGGLNLQHSIEYWLTLDLLASELSKTSKPGSAIRVQNSSEADIIFVPFFSSLSYNRYSKERTHGKKGGDSLLQEKLVKYLFGQEEWKRSGGVDHIVLAHHPNSMRVARMQLWPAMFILSDFGRYPPTIANINKDVIAPYKHIIKTFVNDSSGFDRRPILLYFQGAIYRKDGGFIRQELYYLLKDEKDVHFDFGNVRGNGINIATRGMHSSKFCLNIAGDTPSSNRLFDAIASHCVPVIISDEIELPYEDTINYSDFCIFVRASDALKENFLINFIRGIGRDKWTEMWNKLKEIEHIFEYQYPSKEGDAVQMIWQAVARKIPAVRFNIHRSKRFSSYAVPEEKGLVSSAKLPKNFQH